MLVQYSAAASLFRQLDRPFSHNARQGRPASDAQAFGAELPNTGVELMQRTSRHYCFATEGILIEAATYEIAESRQL